MQYQSEKQDFIGFYDGLGSRQNHLIQVGTSWNKQTLCRGLNLEYTSTSNLFETILLSLRQVTHLSKHDISPDTRIRIQRMQEIH